MTADGQKGYNKTGANEQTCTTAYLITFNVTVSSSKAGAYRITTDLQNWGRVPWVFTSGKERSGNSYASGIKIR